MVAIVDCDVPSYSRGRADRMAEVAARAINANPTHDFGEVAALNFLASYYSTKSTIKEECNISQTPQFAVGLHVNK